MRQTRNTFWRWCFTSRVSRKRENNPESLSSPNSNSIQFTCQCEYPEQKGERRKKSRVCSWQHFYPEFLFELFAPQFISIKRIPLIPDPEIKNPSNSKEKEAHALFINRKLEAVFKPPKQLPSPPVFSSTHHPIFLGCI